MLDKKQEIKSSAPKGPMKVSDLQRSMLSTAGKNELYTKYGIKEKEAVKMAEGLKKYGTNFDPDDIRDLKKGLEKTIEKDRHSAEGIKAASQEKFYQGRGTIKP